MANLVKIEVIDQNGKPCDTSFFVPSTIHDPLDAGILDIGTQLQAMIEGGADAISVEVEDNVVVPGTGTAVGYNAADKISCILHSAGSGAVTTIDIPAPGGEDTTPSAIFELDGSVNRSCPAIAALITFLTANALDTDGNPLVFVSGKRKRAERLKTSYG
jgi:hypothetical protein